MVKAFNIINNLVNYNIRTFSIVVDTLSIADLQGMLNLISATGGGPMIDRLRRVSESISELQTLVGLRNTLASAIARLQDKFIDILTNEYPSRHSLVDTRKIKEG